MKELNHSTDKGLLYVEAPYIDPSFTEAFNRLVPDVADRPGTKKLRIVWGCDRLEFCGGFWERRYADTDHDPQKYVGRARWILEGYQSPSIFDKEEWERNKHLLGKWPHEGVFDFIAFHVDNQGGYLPLDERALNHVRIWAHWQEQGKKRSVEELLEAKHALRVKRYKERKEAADRVALRFGERVVKCFEDNVDAVSTVGKNPVGKNFKQRPSGILVME